jgi:bifunctional non-homologous end joining protein LigD
MPLLGRKSPPEPPPNPDDWRPQRFGRGGRSLRDAIIEPGWSGIRVLARFEDGRTRFIDEEGVDCTDEFANVAEAVATAALAGDLILEGHLTVEPTQVVAGVPGVEIQAPTAGQMMVQMLAGNRIGRGARPQRHLDPDRPIAFVAVDLLRIDGTPLLDIPLLERKRLLDGSLAQTDLVRITPFIRPPMGSFITTWRSAGFIALAYKATNSRYLPSARNDDWSIVRMPLTR